MIYAMSTDDEFRGYCKGCALKYRFRAGRKGDATEDIEKAMQYEHWYETVGDGFYQSHLPSKCVDEEVEVDEGDQVQGVNDNRRMGVRGLDSRCSRFDPLLR